MTQTALDFTDQHGDALVAEIIRRTRDHYIPASDEVLEEVLASWLDYALNNGRFDPDEATLCDLQEEPYSTDDTPFVFSSYETVGDFLDEQIEIANPVVPGSQMQTTIRDALLSNLPLDINETAGDLWRRDMDEIIEHVVGEDAIDFSGQFEDHDDACDHVSGLCVDPLCEANIEFAIIEHLKSLPFRDIAGRLRPDILIRIEAEKKEAAEAS